MFEKLGRLETNLRRAGYILSLEVIGGVLLGIMLSYFEREIELVVFFLWIANLPAIWFLAQAAKHQGRSAWLTGLTSIPPLLALMNFLWLCTTASSSSGPRRREV
jgi:hypothetical protein